MKRLEKAGANAPNLPKRREILIVGTVEQRHDLSAGAVCVGTELTVAGAVGDVVLICPSDSLSIVGTI